jgi:hypothetical protein
MGKSRPDTPNQWLLFIKSKIAISLIKTPRSVRHAAKPEPTLDIAGLRLSLILQGLLEMPGIAPSRLRSG